MTTIKEEIEATREAWENARVAIMAAWKITPQPLLRTRMTVKRGNPNQTLAHEAVMDLLRECDRALRSIAIQERARERGLEWAVDDETAVACRNDG